MAQGELNEIAGSFYGKGSGDKSNSGKGSNWEKEGSGAGKKSRNGRDMNSKNPQFRIFRRRGQKNVQWKPALIPGKIF